MNPAVQLKHIPGRGRGLVTTRHVEAGEIVLAEEPLLLTVSQEFKDRVCVNCLCWLEHCPGLLLQLLLLLLLFRLQSSPG